MRRVDKVREDSGIGLVDILHAGIPDRRASILEAAVNSEGDGSGGKDSDSPPWADICGSKCGEKRYADFIRWMFLE